MPERRTQPRKRLIFNITASELITGQMIGHLQDLTPDGLRLLGASVVEPGSILQMRLVMPKPYHGLTELHLEARCVWCNLTDEELYQSGFELLDLPRAEYEALAWLIEQYSLAV